MGHDISRTQRIREEMNVEVDQRTVYGCNRGGSMILRIFIFPNAANYIYNKFAKLSKARRDH